MNKTTTQQLWKDLFPDIPRTYLSQELPNNISGQDLICLVQDNIDAIVSNWTYDIKFRGIYGRLRSVEDNARDIEYRRDAVRRSIKAALSK